MEVFYEPGMREPSELVDFVGELLRELRDGGNAQREAREAGVDVTELLNEPETSKEILIKSEGSGFDPISTVIVVTIVRPMVLDLWRQVFLPRIQRRWGATAIGQEVRPIEPRVPK